MENDLKKEAEILADLLSRDNVRDSTLKNTLDRYKRAKEKLEMFKNLLKFEAEDIENKLNEMEKKVRDKLIGQITRGLL
ncbi:MAG TPA: hypothetical protein ENG63_04980 [Candidatus Desulfofervidus auxilii]|uniref:Uncharacterized protein n=1 Tax=Desulfofervidus auxilii TaxID=1621989 RepID=A0A7C0Y4D8_DESA2|nr:hypothetical protein [Candidatus Desulfofervidus auxilii]